MSDKIKIDENGLVPAIVQDAKTKQVLMLAYMNVKSLKRSVKKAQKSLSQPWRGMISAWWKKSPI